MIATIDATLRLKLCWNKTKLMLKRMNRMYIKKWVFDDFYFCLFLRFKNIF
jgi:hypothetical protein